MQTHFFPSAERAIALDGRMRQRLADSMAYIRDAVRGVLEFDESSLGNAFQRLANGSVSSDAFALYAEIVLALEDDEIEAAESHLAEWADLQNTGGNTRIEDLQESTENGRMARILRQMDSDEKTKFVVFPPAAEDSERCLTLLQEAYSLLERGFPELAEEIRALIREIILVGAPKSKESLIFDGGSAFFLWGMIVLNVNTQETALDMAQALAHESAHNLLFGLCVNGPVTENDEDELHASPLRVDPRPVDGIYHATYVLARMHLALDRLLASGVLNESERLAAEHARTAHARSFTDGYATLQAHARFTPLGRDLLEAAASESGILPNKGSAAAALDGPNHLR